MISKFTRACAQFLGRVPASTLGVLCTSTQVRGSNEMQVASLKGIAARALLTPSEQHILTCMGHGHAEIVTPTDALQSLQQQGYLRVQLALTEDGALLARELIARPRR